MSVRYAVRVHRRDGELATMTDLEPDINARIEALTTMLIYSLARTPGIQDAILGRGSPVAVELLLEDSVTIIQAAIEEESEA